MTDTARSALIVASDSYEDPGLGQLCAPAHDADALARVLGDEQIGGFDVQTVFNEPAHHINLAIEDFFADRQPDDLLLLHVSCHGVKDEGGELHFATRNTDLRRLASTSVAADFVSRRMARSRSRRIVLLLDCCYSGAFEGGMTARAGSGVAIEEQFGGRGRAVITASSAMEYAFEGGSLTDTRAPAPSVFTTALVEGLDSGEADQDQDGMVALDELYEYVYGKVRATTPNQTPCKWSYGVQGALYIARRARPVTTPTPLPAELQEVVDHPLPGVRVGAVKELTRLLQARHAGLALAARLALEQLTDDDSRTVAAEASAALATSPFAGADPQRSPTDPGPSRTSPQRNEETPREPVGDVSRKPMEDSRPPGDAQPVEAEAGPTVTPEAAIPAHPARATEPTRAGVEADATADVPADPLNDTVPPLRAAAQRTDAAPTAAEPGPRTRDLDSPPDKPGSEEPEPSNWATVLWLGLRRRRAVLLGTGGGVLIAAVVTLIVLAGDGAEPDAFVPPEQPEADDSDDTVPPEVVACDGTPCTIEIQNVRLDTGELLVEWWPDGFEAGSDEVHALFYWAADGPSEVAEDVASGVTDAGSELTDEVVFAPEDHMRLWYRPPDAEYVCVTVAGGDHAPIDAAEYHCAELPAGSERFAYACNGDNPCIEMVEVAVEDGELKVEWDAVDDGFEPDTSATHAHFFWNSSDPSKVGTHVEDRDGWELTDKQPWIPEKPLMQLANRPTDADGVCVTAADGAHAVIDPANYHCVPLPEGV